MARSGQHKPPGHSNPSLVRTRVSTNVDTSKTGSHLWQSRRRVMFPQPNISGLQSATTCQVQTVRQQASDKVFCKGGAGSVLGRQGQEPGLLGFGIFTAVMGRKSSICSCFYKRFFKGLTVTARGWQSLSPINYFQVFFSSSHFSSWLDS